MSERFAAPVDAPRLDVLLALRLDVSRNHAATLIANGHVLVDGRREKASYRAREGEQISVQQPPPTAREVAGEDIPLDIRFEDD
ncbi:MAG TPA: S4 domain-containing protein, partial [Gemmatimonadaceae bacterium]|nr:S4 domain-containing protein [Gemmatimonadaceae bacterium]